MVKYINSRDAAFALERGYSLPQIEEAVTRQVKHSGEVKIQIKRNVKVGVLRPVLQSGSHWDRCSVLSLVGLKPQRGDNL